MLRLRRDGVGAIVIALPPVGHAQRPVVRVPREERVVDVAVSCGGLGLAKVRVRVGLGWG